MSLECDINTQRGVAILTGDVQYPNTNVTVQRTVTPTVESSWVTIRGGVRTGVNPGGLTPFEDSEMPLGQPVFYRMLMTLPANAQRFVQRQLISNPMFDQDTQTAPEDWKTVAPHVLTYVNTDLGASGPLNGTSMARVSADPQPDLLYTVPLSHTGGAPGWVAGKRYRLTGYVQVLSPPGQLWQNVYDFNTQTWDQLGDTGVPWSDLLVTAAGGEQVTEVASLNASIKVAGGGATVLAPIKVIGLRPEARGKWTFFAAEFTAPTVVGYVPRINLVPNPSLEVDASNWAPVTGAWPVVASRSTAWSQFGTASLALTTSGAGTLSATPFVPAVAGDIFTFSAYAKASTTARRVRIFFYYFTAADVIVGSGTFSAWQTDSISAPLRLYVTGTVPATAVKLKAVIQVADSAGEPVAPVGEVHYFDGMLLEKKSTVGTYFDGSMPGYTWQGTANASSSAEVAPTAANTALTLSHGGTGTEPGAVFYFDKLQILQAGDAAGAGNTFHPAINSYIDRNTTAADVTYTAPDTTEFSHDDTIVVEPNGAVSYYGPSITVSYAECELLGPDYSDKLLACAPIFLQDPIAPALGMWVGLISIGDITYAARQDLYPIVNRFDVVAVSDKRIDADTDMVFFTHTLEEREAVLALFAPGRILFLRNADSRYPENNWYIACGDLVENRVFKDHRRPERSWAVPINKVEAPEGLIALTTTPDWQDIKDQAGGWRELAQSGTWLDITTPGGSSGTFRRPGRSAVPRIAMPERLPTVQAATAWALSGVPPQGQGETP